MGKLCNEQKTISLLPEKYYYSKTNSDNLLLLSESTKYFRLEFNSDINKELYAYESHDNYLQTLLYKKGLYLINFKVSQTPWKLQGYNVITVEEQSKELFNLECTKAKAVQELSHMLICPNDTDICHAVDQNILGNIAFQCIDI